jgi:hypothetical protein
VWREGLKYKIYHFFVLPMADSEIGIESAPAKLKKKSCRELAANFDVGAFFREVAEKENAIQRSIAEMKAVLKAKFKKKQAFLEAWKNEICPIFLRSFPDRVQFEKDYELYQRGKGLKHRLLIPQDRKDFFDLKKRYASEAQKLNVDWEQLLRNRKKSLITNFLGRLYTKYFGDLFDKVIAYLVNLFISFPANCVPQ